MDSLMHARLRIGSGTEGKTWKERKSEIEDRFFIPAFVHEQLLILAFTHFSYGLFALQKEFKALARHGDKVIYYYLSRKLLQLDFNDRQRTVDSTRLLSSNVVLDECGKRMGLCDYMLHKGTDTKNPPREKYIADVFEALVGAIDVEHGADETCVFLDNWLWSQKDTFAPAEAPVKVKQNLSPDEQRWETLKATCADAYLPEPKLVSGKRDDGNGFYAHAWTGSVMRSAYSTNERRAQIRAIRALIKAIVGMS